MSTEEVSDCVGKIHCETLADCHSFDCPHWGHDMVGIKLRDHVILVSVIVILVLIQLSQLAIIVRKNDWIEEANKALNHDNEVMMRNQQLIIQNQETIKSQTKER